MRVIDADFVKHTVARTIREMHQMEVIMDNITKENELC